MFTLVNFSSVLVTYLWLFEVNLIYRMRFVLIYVITIIDLSLPCITRSLNSTGTRDGWEEVLRGVFGGEGLGESSLRRCFSILGEVWVFSVFFCCTVLYT